MPPTEYTWTQTPAGAVRMVVGVKDKQPVVIEATVVEIDLAKVKTRLALFVGDALAWEDVCNLVRDPDRERVLRLVKQKKEITIPAAAFVALLQACRTAALPRSEPHIETATAETPVIPLADLLAAVEQLLGRFVVFQSDADVVACTLWVAHTYTIDAVEVTPYLYVHSVEPQSGKSRLLEVLEVTACRAWFVVGASEAAIFRKIAGEKPSLLLDEVDTIFKKRGDSSAEGLRAILNAGYRRGAMVPRVIAKSPDSPLAEFPTFCAKAFAGLGLLPQTVRTRSIHIALKKRKATETVAKFKQRTVKAATAPLREGLATWAAAALPDLARAVPVLPDALRDRAEELWEPLVAIADLAGGEWPARARAAALDLQDGGAGAASRRVELLAAIKDIFTTTKTTDQIFTVELLAALVDRDGEPWAEAWGPDLEQKPPRTQGPATKLASLLRPLGIKSGTIRAGDVTGKGYKVPDFADAFERYLPAPPSPTPSPPSQSMRAKGSAASASRHTGAAVTASEPRATPCGSTVVTAVTARGGDGVMEGAPSGSLERKTAQEVRGPLVLDVFRPDERAAQTPRRRRKSPLDMLLGYQLTNPARTTRARTQEEDPMEDVTDKGAPKRADGGLAFTVADHRKMVEQARRFGVPLADLANMLGLPREYLETLETQPPNGKD